MIRVIAAREFRSLFASPLAWVVLAILQLMLAWMFLGQLSQYLDVLPRLALLANPQGITEIVGAPVYGWAGIVLLMAVPLLTMRLFSEEKRNQTLTLLLSAPVSTADIVLGKFFGLMGLLLIAVGMVTLMAVSLALGGPLDWGLIASNALGLILLTGAFAAVGLWVSSLTQHAVIAAFAGFGALLLLWMLSALIPDPNHPLLYLSLMKHFENFNRGLIDTADLAYFVLFAATFLLLTLRRLDAQRLQG